METTIAVTVNQEPSKAEARKQYMKAYHAARQASMSADEKEAKRQAAAARRAADPDKVRAIERRAAAKRRKEKPEAVRAANQRADLKRAHNIVRRAAVAKTASEWQSANRTARAAQSLAYKGRHVDELKARRHTEEFRAHSRAYMNRRWETNLEFRFIATQRARLYRGLKCGKFSTATRDLIGADWEIVKAYLEVQFVPGMTWENQGTVWHVDHKFPLSRVDHSDFEQVLRATHYTNLQPLFVEDNLRKNATISHELPPLSSYHQELLALTASPPV